MRTSGAHDVSPDQMRAVRVKGVKSFEELKDWLGGFASQPGAPHAICNQTGTPYTEVVAGQIVRPGDETFGERVVAQDMEHGIANVIARAGIRRPMIYWRIPFETDTGIAPQVVEYRDDGPDTEFSTDRKCVMDRNWRYVKAYCRFAVGEK